MMLFMIYLSALIIPILSYLLQIYPRLLNKYYGLDVWVRMFEADLFRKNGHRIPMEKIREGFILEGYFVYPPAFPWLLSFFSKKTLLRVQGFISPIFDAIHNILIFFITYQITGDLKIALLAQIVYTTIPLTILENSYLTPRSLGYLLFTLAFYPLILYSINPNTLFLAISFISLVVCFFAHKFPIQSFLFISIFFLVIERNPLYILMFFTAMGTAFVISKGYYYKILGEHIANIYLWTTNFRHRFSHQVKQKNSKIKTDFVSYIYLLLGKVSPLSLLGTNPWTLVPLFFFLDKILKFNPVHIDNPLYFKLSLWVLFFYLFSILVLSIKHLTPIGEGQRYMEMALAPTAILTSVFFTAIFQTDFRFWAVIIFFLIALSNLGISIFLQWRLVVKDKDRTMTKEIQEGFKYINTLKFKPRILCLPQKIAYMVMYNTKSEVLVDFQPRTAAKIADVYPVLTKPIKEIARKYKLNLLVLKKDYASLEDLGLKTKSVAYETEDIQIIKI